MRSPSGTRAAHRLLLARDRFGIKPLYYRQVDGTLSFASELKAMLEQPGFSRQIDPRAVAAYLAFNSIPAPLTIFAEARKLPAGTLAIWRDGELTQTRYARPSPVPAGETRRRPESALADELRETLRGSIRAHLVADVPVGVLLSGGVDSAGIVALAAGEQADPVKTFSVGFEEASFDELDRARLVAERYGTDHHEIVLRPDAVELFPKLVEAFDEPFGDSSALPTYLVSELAAGEVKVALSGEGGDELFGGYYTYVADLLAPRVGRLAALAAPLAEMLPSSNAKVSLDYKAKRFARGAGLPPLERHHAWKEIFSRQLQASLLGDRDSGWDPVDLYRERYAETAGAEPLARLQDVDLGIYLVDDLLVKTDRSSMAHSLELRVPFLDNEVAAMAHRPGDAAQGSRPGQEAVAAERSCAAAAEGGSARPEAGLLDPRRRLAARAAAGIRARNALGGDLVATRLARPRNRHRAARPPLCRPRGPQSPALGIDRLHALVRQVRHLVWTRCRHRSKPSSLSSSRGS